MDPIILASSSPRRQEILKSLKIPFKVIMPNTDETISTAIQTEDIPEYLARKKIASVLKSLPSEQKIPWILGADTIIDFNSKVYGKPQNQDEAFTYIKQFQGKSQTVITSLVLYNGIKNIYSVRTSKTKVYFAPMTDEEIQWYIETGEWHGAAGGYRIQGAATRFISKIEGSFSGVIGLPIFELYDILKEQGYSILD